MDILISPVGGKAIHGIVEYFHNKGHRVTGIDSDKRAIGRCLVDKFIQVPQVGGHGYEPLIDYIAEGKIFFTWLDEEVLFWNRPGTPGYNHLYGLLTNKWFLSKMAGLTETYNTARTYIAKPARGTGSRGVIEIPSGYVIQPKLTGPEYTIDFFALDGEVINHVIRKRIKADGVSLIGEVCFNDGLSKLVGEFAERYELSGLHNIQVIDGYITDFNPRPSGTIMLSITAGVDLLQNVMDWKNGIEPVRYGKPELIRMVRMLHEHYEEVV